MASAAEYQIRERVSKAVPTTGLGLGLGLASNAVPTTDFIIDGAGANAAVNTAAGLPLRAAHEAVTCRGLNAVTMEVQCAAEVAGSVVTGTASATTAGAVMVSAAADSASSRPSSNPTPKRARCSLLRQDCWCSRIVYCSHTRVYPGVV